jgi:hypothetical protein
VHHSFHLTKLDGDLCALVDLHFGGAERYELWVRTTASNPARGVDLDASDRRAGP